MTKPFSIFILLFTAVLAVSAVSADPSLPLPADSESVTPADFPAVASPAMKWAQGTFAKDPSVIRFRGKYLLYYSYFPTENRKGDEKPVLSIGIASSDDLTNWRFEKNIFPMQEVDSHGLGAPCAKVFGGKVFLFYQTYGTGASDAICLARSDDGLNFTPHPDNPIFRPHGDWTNGRAIDADVVLFRDKLFLYAATRDPQGTIQKLAVATADPAADLGPEAWTQAADFSILEPALPWEKTCIEAPSAIVRDGRLYLFYAGAYNNNPQQIGVAVSEDGIHFTRLWDVPFIPNGKPGAWNASESGHPGIFTDEDGSDWLFFQGNATGGKDWYLSRVAVLWDEIDGFPVPRAGEEPVRGEAPKETGL
ncbi:MAG: family 43 glycosylhydrolase [Thermoguttaceae bacterium]|nr:family 43 glycosylhydrolase [Thermoguttaceae bacterium]